MISGIISKIGINFLVGWEALLRNKFRSLLTLIGIILGIFIVVIARTGETCDLAN